MSQSSRSRYLYAIESRFFIIDATLTENKLNAEKFVIICLLNKKLWRKTRIAIQYSCHCRV